MKPLAHAATGLMALSLIASFWISTLVSELFLSYDAVELVKRYILDAMWLLIPALAITGGSGAILAKGRLQPILRRKARRMPIIALNGMLILLPAAFYLHTKAAAAEFDGYFYGAQAVELVAGALNLTLIALNLRDGLTLTGRLQR